MVLFFHGLFCIRVFSETGRSPRARLPGACGGHRGHTPCKLGDNGACIVVLLGSVPERESEDNSRLKREADRRRRLEQERRREKRLQKQRAQAKLVEQEEREKERQKLYGLLPPWRPIQ